MLDGTLSLRELSRKSYSMPIDDIINCAEKKKYLTSLSPSQRRVELLKHYNDKINGFKKYGSRVDKDELLTTQFFKMNPATKKVETYTTTEEVIDAAFKLARRDDEFYCHVTISSYCRKLMYGEIEMPKDKNDPGEKGVAGDKTKPSEEKDR